MIITADLWCFCRLHYNNSASQHYNNSAIRVEYSDISTVTMSYHCYHGYCNCSTTVTVLLFVTVYMQKLFFVLKEVKIFKISFLPVKPWVLYVPDVIFSPVSNRASLTQDLSVDQQRVSDPTSYSTQLPQEQWLRPDTGGREETPELLPVNLQWPHTADSYRAVDGDWGLYFGFKNKETCCYLLWYYRFISVSQ